MTKTLRFDRSLWVRVDILSRNLDQVYARVTSSLELSVAEFHVLRALIDRDGQRPSELAAAVGRNATAFTPLLDALEHKGLVSRRRDQTDRRALQICLTEDGEALRRRIQDSAEQIERSVRRMASKEDWATFEQVLALLVHMNTEEK